MLDVLSWLVLTVAILAIAYLLTSLFWRPERNIDRSMLGHWFRSLIRLYESDSLVRVTHRGSALRFSLVRRAGRGSECWVVFSCPDTQGLAECLASWQERVTSKPRAFVLPNTSSRDDGRLDVQVSIPDIWSKDAADVSIRIAECLLDTLGIGKEARFDLEFLGEQSMERALEARQRQRMGELQEW